MNAPAQGDARRPVAFISHHSSQASTARHYKALLERNGIAGRMAPDDGGVIRVRTDDSHRHVGRGYAARP